MPAGIVDFRNGNGGTNNFGYRQKRVPCPPPTSNFAFLSLLPKNCISEAVALYACTQTRTTACCTFSPTFGSARASKGEKEKETARARSEAEKHA